MSRHPAFPAPADPDQKIWRYMSVAKLLRMIQTSALHFSVTARLDDQWEGVPPARNRALWAPQIVAMYEAQRKLNAVNCWHMAADESALLWSKYASEREGVAIQSTFRRLEKCFRKPVPDGSVYVGTVTYIDFDEDKIPPSPVNVYLALMHKRRFFADEREVRAVFMPDGMLRAAFEQGSTDGRDVPVDLNVLIDGIYVAGGDWVYEALRASIPEEYRPRVSRSRFTDTPGEARGFVYPTPPV